MDITFFSSEKAQVETFKLKKGDILTEIRDPTEENELERIMSLTREEILDWFSYKYKTNSNIWEIAAYTAAMDAKFKHIYQNCFNKEKEQCDFYLMVFGNTPIEEYMEELNCILPFIRKNFEIDYYDCDEHGINKKHSMISAKVLRISFSFSLSCVSILDENSTLFIYKKGVALVTSFYETEATFETIEQAISYLIKSK